MNRLTVYAVLFVMLLVGADISLATDITILHSFNPNSGDGYYPSSSLIYHGSTFYGTTNSGGSNGGGVLYSMNADGSGYKVLRNFSQDGAVPMGNLALDGSTLYGMTSNGGGNQNGVIYSISLNGSDYQVLKNFDLPPAGKSLSGLTIEGSWLYGTINGIAANPPLAGYPVISSSIFKMSTDGAVFQTLSQSTSGGGPFTTPCPYGPVSVGNSKVYGVFTGGTVYGGDEGNHFYSFNTDGTQPTSKIGDFGSDLTLSGSRIYGTTQTGGAYGYGQIFSMNTDGTDLQIMHSFTDGGDGILPQNGLTLSGSTLYGATFNGGTANGGTIFSINTDGSGYQILCSLNGGINSGYGSQISALTVIDSTIYASSKGFGYNGTIVDGGAIFCIPIPEPSTLVLLVMGILGIFTYICEIRVGNLILEEKNKGTPLI